MKHLLIVIAGVILLAFGVVLLSSCNKEEQVTPEVTFILNPSEFEVENGYLKSEASNYEFIHIYPRTNVNFVSDLVADVTYENVIFTDQRYTLPAGWWRVYTSSNTSEFPTYSDRLGSPSMEFGASSSTFALLSNTTVVDITVTPRCYLVIVEDQHDLLDSAWIEYINIIDNEFGSRELYVHPQPVTSPQYYAYLARHGGTQPYDTSILQVAHTLNILKKNGSFLELPIHRLNIGDICVIRLIDNVPSGFTLRLSFGGGGRFDINDVDSVYNAYEIANMGYNPASKILEFDW